MGGRLPPSQKDKGYAWVIVFSTFFLQAIGDGVRFCYGLLFVEFLEEFEQGKGTTAWIGSLMLGVFNMGGPLSAVIINKFGFRVGGMLGSIITAIALVLSSFATSVTFLYFSYGVLHGFGSGLYFLAGTVATGKYFKEKKALAIGITFCGGGIGTFVILPLARVIIDFYTWRGAMFILAGIVLQGCVFLALFRPFIEEDSTKDKAKNNTTDTENPVESAGDDELQNTTLLAAVDSMGENKGEEDPQNNLATRLFHSLNDLRVEEATIQKSSVLFYSSRSLNSSLFAHHAKQADNCLDGVNLQDGEATVLEKQFQNKFVEHFLPKALVTNTNFLVLMLSVVFIAIPEFVPYSMLPDFGLHVGCLPSQTAWFLAIVGIFSMMSNIGSGWLADLKCVHNLSFLGGSVLTVGAITMTIAVIPTLETFFVYSALYGVFSAAMYGVQTVLLIEYFGERRFASILGITMWVYGISGLIGTPTAGWLFDVTGSYTLTFLATGACFVLSGLITFLVLCTGTSRNMRQKKSLAKEALKNVEVEVK